MNEEKINWKDIYNEVNDPAILQVTARNLQLDADCVATFAAAEEKLLPEPELQHAVVALLSFNEQECVAQLQLLAEKTGIHRLTVNALALIHAIPLLQRLYEMRAVPVELMWDTMIDLKCKFTEEHDMSGIWGTGAMAWYMRVFTLRIIKLGRLEFEPIGYKWETPYHGIRKGDPVMNMHIPSTGPMRIEDVLDSFKRAYRFFGYTEPMPVVAASWLVYPPVCEQVMKPGSNLRNFYELFDVVESYEDPDNKNFWRIFNMEWAPGVLDQVPLDTSLRRNLHAFMKPGVNMGVGRCMLLFDGEKVISR